MATPFFKENVNEFNIVKNDDYMVKDANDIIYTIKSARRKISEQIEQIEYSKLSFDEKDEKIARLIRQDQYLKALSNKEKNELESLLINKSTLEQSLPDIFQWYKPE